MLRSKLARHSLAFGLILFASFALYPAAQRGNDLLIRILLAIAAGAALLTLIDK